MAEDSSNIFFIVGSGRCGTTITAQILNSHSQICVPHELQILFEYSGNGKRLYEHFSDGIAQNFNAKNFIDLIHSICPHKFELFFDYDEFFRKQRYPINDLKILVNDLFSEIAVSKGKTIFGEQTPWYGQRIDILNELFPDAKFIHLVRDGRDVAISFARTPWWHNDVNLNLERWAKEVETIQYWEENLLKEGQMITIRYEDLVIEPQTNLTRICNHIGVKYEKEMLDPNRLIDYSVFSKNYNKQNFSKEFVDWKNKGDSIFFDQSCFNWKNQHEFIFNNFSELAQKLFNHFNY
jgi:hypothetical protein